MPLLCFPKPRKMFVCREELQMMILSTERPLYHVMEPRYGPPKFFGGKPKIPENAFLPCSLVRSWVSFWPVAVSSLGIFHPEAIKLIQTLSRYKSVRLGLDEKKTFNQEMKLLSCQLQRGNSLMFTNKSVDFAENQMDNNNNHDLSVID